MLRLEGEELRVVSRELQGRIKTWWICVVYYGGRWRRGQLGKKGGAGIGAAEAEVGGVPVVSR